VNKLWFLQNLKFLVDVLSINDEVGKAIDEYRQTVESHATRLGYYNTSAPPKPQKVPPDHTKHTITSRIWNNYDFSNKIK